MIPIEIEDAEKFLKESVKKEEYKCLPITYKFETLPNDGFVKSPVVKEREVVSLIPAYELPAASSKAVAAI